MADDLKFHWMPISVHFDSISISISIFLFLSLTNKPVGMKAGSMIPSKAIGAHQVPVSPAAEVSRTNWEEMALERHPAIRHLKQRLNPYQRALCFARLKNASLQKVPTLKLNLCLST
jgi:hypothetical protein